MLKPMPWRVADVIEATGGTRIAGDSDAFFEAVCIDSRTVSAGDLFVAIKGPRHDGHDYIKEVLAKGCRGILIQRTDIGDVPNGVVCIRVPDTTRALGHLGTFQRERSNTSVIAVTGSNGKTTTRELISAVFSQKFPTLTTAGNFNNEIGLPLTLLRIGRQHQWAVVELGMNHPGEIRALARICRPDIGVITNVAPAHLEGVGCLDGVAKAKGELIPEINHDGAAILNADDARVAALAQQTTVDVLLYGTSEQANVRARDIKRDGTDQIFTLEIGDTSTTIRLQSPGAFMVGNALAAAAVATSAGIDLGTIKKGIEMFRPVGGRMNIFQSVSGVNIIDDTYNANPGSMQHAIRTLVSLKGNGRAFAALGDMFELGDQATDLHREIGELAAKWGVDFLSLTGEHAPNVAAGAKRAGMEDDAIFIGTHEEIATNLAKRLRSGDWLLAKGSRAMRMETVIQGLRDI